MPTRRKVGRPKKTAGKVVHRKVVHHRKAKGGSPIFSGESLPNIYIPHVNIKTRGSGSRTRALTGVFYEPMTNIRQRLIHA